MPVVLPDDKHDQDVPEVPAKVKGFQPNLPADFLDGDTIALDIELDRPLTTLELRLMNERGPRNWVGLAGVPLLRVELGQLSESLLKRVQAALDKNHAWAVREVEKAAVTRSLLDRIAAEWPDE